MGMTQVNITISYAGTLGTEPGFSLMVGTESLTEEEAHSEIERLWSEFQGTHPDTDGHFALYLEDNGFELMDSQYSNLYLTG